MCDILEAKYTSQLTPAIASHPRLPPFSVGITQSELEELWSYVSIPVRTRSAASQAPHLGFQDGREGGIQSSGPELGG